MALEFNDANFEAEVLNSAVPVVVDFWATWCGPCRQIAPIIEELARDNAEVKVGKLDVDSSGATAERYGISSIPSILVFKNGEVVESVLGAQPKSVLQKLIDRHK